MSSKIFLSKPSKHLSLKYALEENNIQEFVSLKSLESPNYSINKPSKLHEQAILNATLDFYIQFKTTNKSSLENNSMKNLIIGGYGFVGSRLIMELGENNCTNLDKNKSPFYSKITTICDVRKTDDIKMNTDVKTTVLLAAEHRDDISPTSLYYDVNVEDTMNTHVATDKTGVKNFIFTSSAAIYGLNKTNPDENHPEDPFNHNGKSKCQAEKVIREWYENAPEGKSVTIIRPTVIFSERNRGNVYNLLKQISSGKFMMIGKGQNKKSMVYVGSIVALIKDRLDKTESGYQVFNYADKPDFFMKELVKLIECKMNISVPKVKTPYLIGLFSGHGFDLLSLITGKKLSISSVRIRKFCATTQFNTTKVHSGFLAPYTLKEGLDLTLEHEFINTKEDEILFYSE